MRLPALLLASVVLGGGAVGAATVLRTSASSVPWTHDTDDERPGPDSARVASLFMSLQATDPVICEMITDQIGNFWMGHHRAIGQFASSPQNVAAAKDSISSRVRDPRAVELLVKNLGAQNTCVRRLASKMLGNSSIDARRLATLLASSDATIRESAAFAAGHRDTLDMRDALENTLSDRAPAVAAMAAWALGEGDDSRVIPALLKSARHADAHVRASVIWALGNVDDDDHRYQTSIVSVLADALGDRDVEVQRAAADAFTSVDELHTAPAALVNALSSSDAEVRNYAAHALAEIADPATTKELISLITHPDVELRKSAVEALGQIGTKEAVAGIAKALNDKSPAVRKAAVEALGEAKEQ